MNQVKITNFQQFDFERIGGTDQKNAIITLNDDSETSDGYHTMNELYDHRFALYIALCKSKVDELYIWRSQAHADGSMYDGHFILGIDNEPGKQITYHLPMILWNKTEFAQTLDRAPDFDGHTAADVIDRLYNF